jgi:hypothetical protein
MDLGRFVMRNQAGKIQKNIIPPSKIVDRGAETIPRCWSGRCGHGGGRTKLLALAESVKILRFYRCSRAYDWTIDPV